MIRRISVFLLCGVAVVCVIAFVNRWRVPASVEEMPPAIGTGPGDARGAASEQAQTISPVAGALEQSTVEGRRLSSAEDVDASSVQERGPNRSGRVESDLLGFLSRQPNLGITSIDVGCGETHCDVRMTGLTPVTTDQFMQRIMADDLLPAFAKSEGLSFAFELTKVTADFQEFRFRFSRCLDRPWPCPVSAPH